MRAATRGDQCWVKPEFVAASSRCRLGIRGQRRRTQDRRRFWIRAHQGVRVLAFRGAFLAAAVLATSENTSASPTPSPEAMRTSVTIVTFN